jgi:hypothetical protein
MAHATACLPLFYPTPCPPSPPPPPSSPPLTLTHTSKVHCLDPHHLRRLQGRARLDGGVPHRPVARARQQSVVPVPLSRQVFPLWHLPRRHRARRARAPAQCARARASRARMRPWNPAAAAGPAPTAAAARPSPAGASADRPRSPLATAAPPRAARLTGQWGAPIVNAYSTLTMLAGALPAMIESLGDYYACRSARP